MCVCVCVCVCVCIHIVNQELLLCYHVDYGVLLVIEMHLIPVFAEFVKY